MTRDGWPLFPGPCTVLAAVHVLFLVALWGCRTLHCAVLPRIRYEKAHPEAERHVLRHSGGQKTEPEFNSPTPKPVLHTTALCCSLVGPSGEDRTGEGQRRGSESVPTETEGHWAEMEGLCAPYPQPCSCQAVSPPTAAWQCPPTTMAAGCAPPPTPAAV